MKVLHIANWFPDENDLEGIWIKRHIESLFNYADQEVWHIAVKPSNTFKIIAKQDSDVNRIIVQTSSQRWFLIEILNFLLLAYVLLFKLRGAKFDVINFHIAYPQLTHLHLVKKFIKSKIVITEHWSAYHFEFNVHRKNKLSRVRKIFAQSIPVIAVSQSLLDDIRRFSQSSGFRGFVVPNIVDTSVFFKANLARLDHHVFLMASQWKEPKNPFLIIETLEDLRKKGWQFQLRIIGYGPQWQQLNDVVDRSPIKDLVVFLGKRSSREISVEMNKASAFVHCSEYETFSVVCAEALSCGTPVLASAVGGIKELVNDSNGILAVSNTVDSWRGVFEIFQHKRFERDLIAEEAIKKYSINQVGKKYYAVLNEIVNAVK